jgi:hypothetical protein
MTSTARSSMVYDLNTLGGNDTLLSDGNEVAIEGVKFRSRG